MNLARDYRQDLYAIFEETCAEIEAGGTPVEFQPLLRIVRRLRCGEAAALGALDALDTDDLDDEEVENVENAENAENDARGADGAHAAGCRQPFAGIANLDPRLLPEQLWRRLAGEDAAPAPPCQTCWARQLCSHSVYVASPLAKEDPRDPSRERCTFWSAEVEMAVRLYHRLSQIDAGLVRRYFADSPEGQAAARPAWRHAKDGEMLGFSKPS